MKSALQICAAVHYKDSELMVELPPPTWDIKAHKLEATPHYLIGRSYQRADEIFSELVTGDFTPRQAAVLIGLRSKSPLSQSELSEITGIDRSTLKEMLGRMIKRGWIDRRRDPHDSRSWLLAATPQGAEFIDSQMATIAKVQERILEPLPDYLRPAFMSCLRILIGMEA